MRRQKSVGKSDSAKVAPAKVAQKVFKSFQSNRGCVVRSLLSLRFIATKVIQRGGGGGGGEATALFCYLAFPAEANNNLGVRQFYTG